MGGQSPAREVDGNPPDDDGGEYAADVAASGENSHDEPAAVGHLARDERDRWGMIGRAAQPAKEDEGQKHPIARRQSVEKDRDGLHQERYHQDRSPPPEIIAQEGDGKLEHAVGESIDRGDQTDLYVVQAEILGDDGQDRDKEKNIERVDAVARGNGGDVDFFC